MFLKFATASADAAGKIYPANIPVAINASMVREVWPHQADEQYTWLEMNDGSRRLVEQSFTTVVDLLRLETSK